MPNNRFITELVDLVTSKTAEFQKVHQELVELRQELSNSVVEANKALEVLNSTLNGSEAVSVAPVASSDLSTASGIPASKPEPVVELETASESEPEEKPKVKRGRPRKNVTVEEPRTGEKRPVEEVDPKIDPVEPVTIAEENTEEVVSEETAGVSADDVVGNAVVEIETDEEAEAEADAVEDGITDEDGTESPAYETPAEDDDTEDGGLTFDFDFEDDSEAAKPSNDDEDFDNINVDEGAEGEQDVSSIDDILF